MSGSRVLDLADEKGELCGAILADLGADVTRIERPGGERSRSIGPFWRDIVNPEKSLHWFAYNRGKRSITLNLKNKAGRQILKRLLKRADFFIESSPPGYMSKLGLDYAVLAEINPRIILTSITPFGQTGPYRDYKGSDITLMAMGGAISITGDADRAPVCLPGNQAYNLAGAYAAAATMMAHYFRQMTGCGQHIDVSIYECVVRLNHREPLHWEFERRVSKRTGQKYIRGEIRSRLIWPCQDGYINWLLYGGETGAAENSALVRWMDEEGKAGVLREFDWHTLDLARLSQSELELWEELIGKFFLKFPKKKLEHEASRRGIRIVPVCDIAEVFQNEQLLARNFWIDLYHPEFGASIKYPGQLFLSNRAEIKARHRAPLIGEHNVEIYKDECGLTIKEIESLRQRGII